MKLDIHLNGTICYIAGVCSAKLYPMQPVLNLTIKNTANQSIELLPGFPEGTLSNYLPGGNKWSAKGDFGTILIEEYNAGSFTIRYTFFSLLKKLTAQFRTHAPAICTRIATKSDWHFSLGAENEIRLKQGQFVLYNLNAAREKIVFEKGREYRSFDLIQHSGKLEELVQKFPTLAKIVSSDNNGRSVFPAKPGWAAPEMMDILRDIPECNLDGDLREFYFSHRMQELFFLLLTWTSKYVDVEYEEIPTEDEIIAVREVERIITSDIRKHYSIPALARKVMLNEFRLKHLFKHTYNVGIFEYLLRARMEEAKRLITQTDLSITDIASLTGYQRITSFITAYRRHFNVTPGSVRREIERRKG